MAYNLGRIENTGSNLFNYVKSLSGDVYSTGSVLDGKINILSGVVSYIQVTGSSVIPTPNLTGIGGITILLSGANNVLISGGVGGGAGEANTASNLGVGVGVWADKNAVDLRFYSFTGVSGINLYRDGNEIKLSSTVDTSNFASTSNLYSTGSTLDNKINSLSGYSNTIFATVTNLQSTGNNLQNQINSISGSFAQFGMSVTNYPNVITTGRKGVFQIGYNMIIRGWNIISQDSGNITVDIQKSTFDNFPVFLPLISGIKPYVSGAYKNSGVNLNDWNTGINARDFVEFTVINSNLTQFTISVTGLKYV